MPIVATANTSVKSALEDESRRKSRKSKKPRASRRGEIGNFEAEHAKCGKEKSNRAGKCGDYNHERFVLKLKLACHKPHLTHA